MAMLTLILRHGVHYDMLFEGIKPSIKNIYSANRVKKLVAQMRYAYKHARLHSVHPAMGHIKQRLVAKCSERSCQWKRLQKKGRINLLIVDVTDKHKVILLSPCSHRC